VSSAAALAVLDVLDDERILQRVRVTGELLRAGLGEVTKGNPFVGEVRGIGLINTVELVRDLETKSPHVDLARRIVNGMRQRGVLIGTCGKDASCLKIRPPLAFTPAEIPLLLSTFEQALSEAAR
jgi:4-aminobutyrate aminotransferase-like enzyme